MINGGKKLSIQKSGLTRGIYAERQSSKPAARDCFPLRAALRSGKTLNPSLNSSMTRRIRDSRFCSSTHVRRKLFGFFVVLFLLSSVFVYAEEEGIQSSTEIQIQISTRPEIRLGFIQSLTFPFLAGTGPLTRGNNIKTVFSADFSPVSLSGKGEIIWTPVAFFLLSGGGQAGSGWNMPLGSGIGINRPEDESPALPRKAILDGEAFDGLLWNTWGAGTLQFDLGAVIPGDWTHVLFQSRQELRYAAYTRAGTDDLWVFENDDRENKNGWTYHANFVLGYNMPLSPVLNTVAFMAEVSKSLYNTPGGDIWGEGLGRWTFSALFNFSVTPAFNAALAVQMRTRRNFGTGNFENQEIYYQDFVLDESEGKRRTVFYRVAAIMTFKIR